MPYIGPIEKNVPIPNDARRKGSPIMNRLREASEGDSFVTDVPYPHVHTYASRLGFTVATAYHSPGRIRVWKLKPKIK